MDYVAQLTYLMFLKIDDEKTTHSAETSLIPEEFSWDKLKDLSGENLKIQYNKTLVALSKRGGIIGAIYANAKNKIEEPSNLESLISFVDDEPRFEFSSFWQRYVYGDILEKNVRDDRADAGQYFTSRPLIKAIVDVMRPTSQMKVTDPACGTGGFLTATYDYMRKPMVTCREDAFKDDEITGNDNNSIAVNLCNMSLYLLDGYGDRLMVNDADSLIKDNGLRYDMVLTHPPFALEEEEYTRGDFTEKICNKPIAFLQHVMTILNTYGRAAMLIPDAVLFDGGASENIRKRLLDEFNLHTILRLPRGTLYEEEIEAHVIFFDKPSSLGNGHGTNDIWVYDCRTNNNFDLPANPLSAHHLADFVKCYNADNICSRKKVNDLRNILIMMSLSERVLI